MASAWRRPRQRHRAARVVASGAAVALLWLTAFPPLRPGRVPRAQAILLTDGYSPDTLRALRRQLGSAAPVWAYGPAPAPAGTRPLTSLLTLAEQRPALRRLHVLGRGLPAAELPLLGPVPVVLHPGPAFAGFRTAYWNQKLTLGEEMRVEGTVAAPAGAAPGWVALRAAGAVRDSVRLPAGGGAFRLRYRPKTEGLAVYELVLRQVGQAPVAEPVPVEVAPAPRPAVLLLAATPAFEFRFLKNYLAEAHYPVALRTTVSRGLVQTDFVNQPVQALDRLTPALLARYALVVADAGTLAGLPEAEARTLRIAVGSGQLGLLVLADAAPLPRAAPARADFLVAPRPASAGPAGLAWPAAPAGVRGPLPAQLRPAPALRPLVTGPGGALAAARRRVGLGAVVVSVVPETFRWALQGQAAVYASFWTRLLAAAVPPAPAAPTWRVGERWPRPFQPLTLHLADALPAAAPTVAPLAGGPPVRLALRQDVRLPEWSTAPYWPAAAGWHTVRGPGRTAHHFYVFPTAAWPGPELLERQQATAQRVLPAATRNFSGPTDATGSEPWPLAWFFGLFLLAAGYLWLEEKL